MRISLKSSFVRGEFVPKNKKSHHKEYIYFKTVRSYARDIFTRDSFVYFVSGERWVEKQRAENFPVYLVPEQRHPVKQPMCVCAFFCRQFQVQSLRLRLYFFCFFFCIDNEFLETYGKWDPGKIYEIENQRTISILDTKKIRAKGK